MKIEVFTEEDYSDCETCGVNSDSGGYVLIDGKEVFRYKPRASCYVSANYSGEDMILKALETIGFEITIDGDRPYACVKYVE